jgi:proteasome lid subunit RPN8/RPN11
MESEPGGTGGQPSAVAWLQAAEPWGEADAPSMPQVVITAAALDDVRRHAESDLHVELGGTLLGSVARHEGRPVVIVEAAIPAQSSEHSAVHFTFTADAWRQLNADREAHFPDLQTVGWFHTHPNLGVFYSSDDVVVHSAAFTQPWHVGLVVDPARCEMAFFGWTQGEEARTLAPLRGCHFVAQEELPAPNWRIAPQAAVWAHRDEASFAASLGGDMVYDTPLNALLATAAPLVGLGVALVGLLALVAVYLLGIRPLQQNVAALEALTVALVDQQLGAANASGTATCTDERLQILVPLPGQAITAGAVLPVVGTAAIDGAARYELAARPAGSSGWQPFATHRGDASSEILGQWAVPLPSGPYELRLRALDRDSTPVAADVTCLIAVDIVNSRP